MSRRLFALAAATLFAAAAAAQHEHHAPAKPPKRQDGSEGGPHAGNHKSKPGQMQVTEQLDRQVFVLRVGVLELPANSDHMAVTQLADTVWPVPRDGWIIAYHPRLVDARGQPVPGRLLHHVAFWNASRSDFLCPNKEEHIFGAGGEMNDWPALPGFGYRVRKGDGIRVNTMFHNPTATDYRQVWLEVTMEFRTAATAQLQSVYPTWFDAQQCGNSGYDLAAGRSATTGSFVLKHSGILLGVGGHMHDYGEKLELVNTTQQHPVAVLPAQLDAAGRIVSMPIVTFLERGGYPLKAGDKLSVTATYRNPSGTVLPAGAMGIVVGYFLPAEDAQMAAYARRRPPAAAARSGTP
jgi:hypothetical protein